MSAIVSDLSPSSIPKIGRPAIDRIFVGILTLLVFLGVAAGRSAAQERAKKQATRDEDLSLVRVNITTETRGPAEPLVINGKRIPNYQPKIIHVFPSTGVVMDDSGHVLTFLGYRWVDLQQPDPRVDIITGKGDQFKGKLVGIDHVLGVAVVNALGGKLRRTMICRGCEIRGGDTVVAPVFESAGESQLLSAQILSVGQEMAASASGSWDITINRRLPGIGDALLDSQRRVLGFVASQQPSREDPMGMRTVAYPIAELLASAEKIIRTGGNIRNGWLGVYLDDSPVPGGIGVRIKSIKEDSPAQKAGLRQQDTVLKLNGEEVHDERQFIRLVQESPVGSKVSLDVQRGGKPLSLQASIQSRQMTEGPGKFVISFPNQMQQADSEEGFAPVLQNFEQADWAGIYIAPLTPQLADFFQIPGQSGVLVLNVDSRMPFSRAGVQAGDVILTVNGQVVDSPQTFFSRLKAYSHNTQRVMVKILRKGVERVMTIQSPLTPSHPSKP
jgi:serine protease Do